MSHHITSALFITRLLSLFITFITVQCFILIPPQTNITDNDESVHHFSTLAYANQLHNPCATGRNSDDDLHAHNTDSYTDLADADNDDNNRHGYGLLRELVAKSTFLQGLTTDIIRMNLIEECTDLRLPYMANVLSLNELNNKSTMESLRALYTSLANQTAHTFFIWHQQQQYIAHNCSTHHSSQQRYSRLVTGKSSRDHSLLLAQHYWTLAVNLRDMMCLTHQTLTTFNIDIKARDAADRVLAHSVKDSHLCSRKAVRDCQVMKTTIALLQYLTDYVRDQLLPMSSSLSSSSSSDN